MPPPLQRNPKFLLWKARADKEGTTSANRGGTDDFIEEELPSVIKQPAQDIVGSYRAVVDFPSHVLRTAVFLGIGLLIIQYNMPKK